MGKIKIRTYGKGELAMLYSPEVQQATACRTLIKWIKKHPQLKTELDETGYQDRAKLLTPKQVELIFKYLGPP